MADLIDLSGEFERLQQMIDNLENAVNKNIAREYANALEDLREIVRKKYDNYAQAGDLTYEIMSKYGRIDNLDKEVAEAARKLHVEASKITRKAMRDTYRQSFRETTSVVGEAAQRTIRGKVKRDVVQQAVQNPVSGLTLNDRLRRNRRLIISQIQETIGQGLVSGDSYSQMSSRLKEFLEDDIVKAHRIVRTETHRVMEKAKFDGLEHASNQGVELKKYWVDSDDERVRSTHEMMGEKYSRDSAIPLDEDFVNDKTGGEGPHPGALGTAEDDINDRCIMVTVVVVEEAA